MAKKKFKVGQIVFAAAALLGIVAIFMLFAPGLSVGHKAGGDTESVSGFRMIFGGEGEKNSYELTFNFVAFLSLLFLIAGLAGVALSLLMPGKIAGPVLAIAGFVLAGIFFFLFRAVLPMSIRGISVGSSTVTGQEQIDLLEKLGFTFSLGVGAVIAGVLSFLSGIASAMAAFVIKK